MDAPDRVAHQNSSQSHLTVCAVEQIANRFA